MTLTVTPETVYLSIIGILMIVQVFQWRSIFKLKDQIDQVWTQMAILVGTFGKEVKELEKKVNDIKK
tara:strand:+ start:2081 stop:2281 length:201 start_codon:yes stop_codon:yes gene_type:complete